MLKSEYFLPYKSDPYVCNTSDLSDGYIFKILDLNIPTSDSHQSRNALEWFRKRDTNGEVFIIDGCGTWFAITALCETKTNTYSYRQVTFHKLASIKFFDKNPNDTTIIFFIKFIVTLRDYEYACRMREVLDECTCLTLIDTLINPVANVRWHINIRERVENKGVVFIAQQVMDAVIDYVKVLVTIQSYA